MLTGLIFQEEQGTCTYAGCGEWAGLTLWSQGSVWYLEEGYMMRRVLGLALCPLYCFDNYRALRSPSASLSLSFLKLRAGWPDKIPDKKPEKGEVDFSSQYQRSRVMAGACGRAWCSLLQTRGGQPQEGPPSASQTHLLRVCNLRIAPQTSRCHRNLWEVVLL